MMKLYPPVLDGVLPACSKQSGNIVLNIPFSFGRVVSPATVKGIAIMIKTPSTGKIITPYSVINSQTNVSEKVYDITYDFTILENSNGVAHFVFSNENNSVFPELNNNEGEYYKIQLAFIDSISETVGYFSTVGVIKYIAEPTLSIAGTIDTENNSIMSANYEYIGIYQQKADSLDHTEIVSKYQFDLIDSSHKIVDSSGEQLHNSSEDTDLKESRDYWISTYDLKPFEKYTLRYSVETINGWKGNFEKIIFNTGTVDIDISLDFQAKLDYQNGCIELWLMEDNIENLPWINFNFSVSRASSKDNYTHWEPLCKYKPHEALQLTDTNVNNLLFWTDYTIEQGVYYKYALQAYNSHHLYSNRIESNREFNKDTFTFAEEGTPLKADFEDAFLFDGERQLRLQFNPKISSFKNTVLENKVETIGSQYPFIFKNAIKKYKEFPISALISLQCDPDDKFLSGLYHIDHSTRKNTPTKFANFNNTSGNLTSDIIYQERQFKLKVLEWLNDGQPKIFRSPTEGNYIIRVMNVSLTPNDTLGRMLHTFNGTAYEVAEYNFQNLRDYGFIDLQLSKSDLIPQFKQLLLKSKESAQLSSARYIRLNSKTTPTTKLARVKLYYNNNSTEAQEIYFNGNYEIKISNNNLLTKIEVVDGDLEIIYIYFVHNVTTNFHSIESIVPKSKIEQIIGSFQFVPDSTAQKKYQYLPYYIIADYDPKHLPTLTPTSGKETYECNILLNTPFQQVATFEWLKIYRRPIERRWMYNNQYYKNIHCTPNTEEQFEYLPTLIYEICAKDTVEPLGYLVAKDMLISPEDWNNSAPYLVKIGMGQDASSDFYLNNTNFEMTNDQLAEFLKINKYMTGTLNGTSLVPLPTSKLGDLTTETNIDSVNYSDLSLLYIGPGLIAEVKYIANCFNYTEEINDSLKAKKIVSPTLPDYSNRIISLNEKVKDKIILNQEWFKYYNNVQTYLDELNSPDINTEELEREKNEV